MVFRGVLQNQRSPSLGEKLSNSVGQLTPSIFQTLGDRQALQTENDSLQRLTGEDVGGLSPNIKRDVVKSLMGSKSQKSQEKQQHIHTALGTIQQMKDLIDATGPINGALNFFSPETRQKRAQFETLGRSLIPMVAAGVPVKNQTEFDEYRKIITNPNSRQADIEGALAGIESVLERSVEDMAPQQSAGNKKEIPIFDLSNPSHKKVRDALMKKFNNNREKVSRELAKNFREE